MNTIELIIFANKRINSALFYEPVKNYAKACKYFKLLHKLESKDNVAVGSYRIK